jgi:dihydropteroate synthase
VPAIEGLRERVDAPISADTFSPEVAREAVEAGAEIVNDIGGGDDAMLEVVARLECGYVLMHIEGPPRMDRATRRYDDVVEHLGSWFGERLDRAAELGIEQERIAVDPGLDFDLGVEDDLELLRRLGDLHSLGRPLFVSLSRKDFLGAVLAGSWEQRLPAEAREWATAAATALAVAEGAQVLRLHDVSALDALRVAGRIVNG